MFSFRNQLIFLSAILLLLVCLQPDQVNGQLKKKKLLKGLMGASLFKLFKSKKGVLPIPLPLPLPLPIDWQTQAGLLSKNQQPAHVSHQPYAQGIQMSPIEFSDYQNAITQALSNGNTYVPTSYSSGNSGASVQSSAGAYSSGAQSSSSGQNENANGYDGASGAQDENTGPASYGVNGVNQNDEYNAYQVSNNEATSGGYRAAAASSLNPNINMHYNQAQQTQTNVAYNGYSNSYMPNYANNQYNENSQSDYSQPASQQNDDQSQQQFSNGAYQASANQQGNYEDNSGSASSNSFVSTSSQQNNYIPLRSVPIYHHHVQQSNYQPSAVASSSSSANNQPQMASNGWVALD